MLFAPKYSLTMLLIMTSQSGIRAQNNTQYLTFPNLPRSAFKHRPKTVLPALSLPFDHITVSFAQRRPSAKLPCTPLHVLGLFPPPPPPPPPPLPMSSSALRFFSSSSNPGPLSAIGVWKLSGLGIMLLSFPYHTSDQKVDGLGNI